MSMREAGRGLRRWRSAGAAAAITALALTGCARGDEEPAPSDPAPATSPAAEPTPSSEEEPAASDGGTASDPADPGSHYLFLPLLDGAESIPADEVDDAIRDFLQTSLDGLECPGDVVLGEQITCTGGQIEGDFLEDVPGTWDVALVRTTNQNTALIVRAAGEDAGPLPLPTDQVFHFAYLVGQEETPEVLAEATAEGFRATQVSDGPSEVDVDVSCEEGEDVERSMVCAVQGEQPADAAGTWHGIGHDSFIEDSAVYLFVEQSAQ